MVILHCVDKSCWKFTGHTHEQNLRALSVAIIYRVTSHLLSAGLFFVVVLEKLGHAYVSSYITDSKLGYHRGGPIKDVMTRKDACA